MPSELDTAWAAGFIDGDGTITLRKVNSSGAKRAPFICVDNTDREMLEALEAMFGGGIVDKGRPTPNHREAWSWRVYGANNVIGVLARVLPYLRCAVKKERARMLVEDWKSVTPRNGHYTVAMAAAKEEFQDRFFDLGAGRGWRSFGELTH
jgi:hypothetical protein